MSSHGFEGYPEAKFKKDTRFDFEVPGYQILTKQYPKPVTIAISE
jgi:hypothetical protein